MFRISKPGSRKKSQTLRPLKELKENKEVVQQKVVEMKLTDMMPQAIKNMRIRKRRAFPVLRDENSWSLLIREGHPKLSICLH